MGGFIQVLRWAWALPATLVGLVSAFGAICLGARPRVVDGVIEICGESVKTMTRVLPPVLRFEAITFGHVVIACSEPALVRLRIHERVHVRQYERWGLFFFPAYLGSSLWQVLRGRHFYYDNHFEVEAFHAAERAARAPRCESGVTTDAH